MQGRAHAGGGHAAGAPERSIGWRNPVVSLARAIERGIEVACNALMLVSGLGLLLLLTIVVVMRYAFESGLEFAPDLSELMFAILVMAGIAQAARRGVHVATQLLISTLHGKWRIALAVLIHAVTAARIPPARVVRRAERDHRQRPDHAGAAHPVERGLRLPCRGTCTGRRVQHCGDRALHARERAGDGEPRRPGCGGGMSGAGA